jgi:hypothetical protein
VNGGEGGAVGRYLVAPAFAVGTVLASGAALADPVDDYVDLTARAVCTRLAAARSVGDIVTLSLIIAREAGFSLRDAASAVGQAAATECPWNLALVTRTRDALAPSGS